MLSIICEKCAALPTLTRHLYNPIALLILLGILCLIQGEAPTLTSCSGSGVQYGDRFVQIGDWRMGDVDGAHFSMAHKDGKTAQIYRKDGTLHRGPRSDYSTWSRSVGSPSGVSFGDRFIQIGDWRIGDVGHDLFFSNGSCTSRALTHSVI